MYAPLLLCAATSSAGIRHRLSARPAVYTIALFVAACATATRALHEIMNAATRGDAEAALTAFTAEYQAKYPKPVASLERDQEKRLTCYDCLAERWIHRPTTNPVESPLSTVRLRQRVTKGAGSRTKGLVMAYKLWVIAEARWCKLNAPHLPPRVQAKVKPVNGIQQGRNEGKGVKEGA